MAIGVVNRLGSAAAILAFQAGVPIEVAYEPESVFTIMGFEIVEQSADEMGFDLKNRPLLNLDMTNKVDWTKLAKKRGVKYEPKVRETKSMVGIG